RPSAWARTISRAIVSTSACVQESADGSISPLDRRLDHPHDGVRCLCRGSPPWSIASLGKYVQGLLGVRLVLLWLSYTRRHVSDFPHPLCLSHREKQG